MKLTFAKIKIMSFTEESSSNSSFGKNLSTQNPLNTFAAQFPADLVRNQSSVSCFSEMNRTEAHNELQGFCPWRWLKRNTRVKCNWYNRPRNKRQIILEVFQIFLANGTMMGMSSRRRGRRRTKVHSTNRLIG